MMFHDESKWIATLWFVIKMNEHAIEDVENKQIERVHKTMMRYHLEILEAIERLNYYDLPQMRSRPLTTP